jgi:hypothetical protein
MVFDEGKFLESEEEFMEC